MQVQDKDSFFKKYEEEYPFLLDLPLYSIYSYFYTLYIEGYENATCKYQIDDSRAHATDIRQVCKSLEIYFSHLQGLVDAHSLIDITKGCEYLGYWIYDKIKHIKSPRDNVTNLYTAIDTFMLGRGLKDKCSNIKDLDISEDKFNKKKELFFHAENLFWIEKEYNPLHKSNSSLYVKYLSECAKYYDEIRLNEYCKKNEEYKPELIYFNTIFNNTKKSLQERGVQIILEDLQSPDLSKCSPEAKSVSHGQADSALRTEHPRNPYSGYPNDEVVTTHGATNDPGTIAGTCLGTSFFKGYQNIIRPLMEKKKQLLNNLEDENNEFIQIPDPNQTNLDNISYHINYHSGQDY
ncbi:PIR protein [Plasmodium ovale]|uniref:PIR protein n=1 Tax=Plasmodium ovale TaxID=36330 RepID=A0A1D3JEM4_PLAOA|nr:PIR protein [Plasmodium ovale]